MRGSSGTGPLRLSTLQFTLRSSSVFVITCKKGNDSNCACHSFYGAVFSQCSALPELSVRSQNSSTYLGIKVMITLYAAHHTFTAQQRSGRSHLSFRKLTNWATRSS